MHDLTAFQRDILYVIAGRDQPSGLAIKRELGEYYNTEINHGRLYPNLDTLTERGILDKAEKDGRTNAYTLTRQGRNRVGTRREWEDNCLDGERAVA